jgi:hypothetical protein
MKEPVSPAKHAGFAASIKDNVWDFDERRDSFSDYIAYNMAITFTCQGG